MRPLRYREIDKWKGFSNEMTHIRDNCFIHMDSQFIDIVFEHADSLECHGFSRSAITNNGLKAILEQPVLRAIDNSLVDIMRNTINLQTLNGLKTVKDVRCACKKWDGNNYVHKIYNGDYASIYAFVYSIAGGQKIVSLHLIDYRSQSSLGSFAVDLDIIESIFNLTQKGRKEI